MRAHFLFLLYVSGYVLIIKDLPKRIKSILYIFPILCYPLKRSDEYCGLKAFPIERYTDGRMPESSQKDTNLVMR
jgi:hypothetical protein